SGEAQLADIACSSGFSQNPTATIVARPGAAMLRIAEVSGLEDFRRPPLFSNADIARVGVQLLGLNLGLITVTGSAAAEIAQSRPSSIEFSSDDISKATWKTGATRDLSQSLTLSLINDLDLSVSVARLELDVLNLVKPAITGVLTGVSGVLDGILDNVLAALGVGVGEADIRVTYASCGRPVLVQ